MSDLNSWFEIARYIGAGGAAVLGIAAYKFWNAYQEELAYSRQHSRETLSVLSAVGEKLRGKEDMESRVLLAIDKLQQTIMDHLLEKDERKKDRTP